MCIIIIMYKWLCLYHILLEGDFSWASAYLIIYFLKTYNGKWLNFWAWAHFSLENFDDILYLTNEQSIRNFDDVLYLMNEQSV